MKTPIEINFIYSDNKEIYCTFKTHFIIAVLFPTKFCLFHNFIIVQIMFFINHALKFKYLPGHLRAK